MSHDRNPYVSPDSSPLPPRSPLHPPPPSPTPQPTPPAPAVWRSPHGNGCAGTGQTNMPRTPRRQSGQRAARGSRRKGSAGL
eukprot:scaffold77090_cov67-Phaeocystis_antarctica.AAC.5